MELSGCSRVFNAEKNVLSLIFADKKYLERVKKAELEDTDFSDPFYATVFSLMNEANEQRLDFTPELLARTMSREDVIKLLSITQGIKSDLEVGQRIEGMAQEIKDNKALKTVQDLLVMISLRIEQRRPRKELLPFIAAIEKLNEDMKSN